MGPITPQSPSNVGPPGTDWSYTSWSWPVCCHLSLPESVCLNTSFGNEVTNLNEAGSESNLSLGWYHWEILSSNWWTGPRGRGSASVWENLSWTRMTMNLRRLRFPWLSSVWGRQGSHGWALRWKSQVKIFFSKSHSPSSLEAVPNNEFAQEGSSTAGPDRSDQDIMRMGAES